MSWLVDLRAAGRSRPGAIGPGRLVLVVGPSGAGKDTLMAGAREALRGDPAVVFPQRIVTRPSSPAEDNATMSVQEFQQAAADGAFALWWEAHGHQYGIPASIDDDVRQGRTVVCNVSRTIIARARMKYAWLSVVLVTAPPEVLEARLTARGRDSDGNLADRIRRFAILQLCNDADVVIHNTGRREAGVRRLMNAIKDSSIFVIY